MYQLSKVSIQLTYYLFTNNLSLFDIQSKMAANMWRNSVQLGHSLNVRRGN